LKLYYTLHLNTRDNEERELEMELRTLREREARVFECKKLTEGCRGVVPCCESLQCYWKDGYSVTTVGGSTLGVLVTYVKKR